MKEIKGKSILVRVSARFELARLKLSGVDCILNILEYDQSNAPLNGHHELPGGGVGGKGGSHTTTTRTFFVSRTGGNKILGPVSRKSR